MRHITPDTTQGPEVTDGPGTPRRRAFAFTGTRGAVMGVIALTAVLAAGGLAAVHVLGSGHGATQATALNSAGARGSGHGAGSVGMPQLAGTPQMAVMPKPAARVPASRPPPPPARGPASLPRLPRRLRRPAPGPRFAPSHST